MKDHCLQQIFLSSLFFFFSLSFLLFFLLGEEDLIFDEFINLVQMSVNMSLTESPVLAET